MNARQYILMILEEFDRNIASLDTVIDRVLNHQQMDHRDRRLVFEIVYGVMRHKMTLDFVLSQFLHDKGFLQNKNLMHILRAGAYQILFLDRIPGHAAVNESVKLAKSDPKTRDVAGVVNAVLRKVIPLKGHLPKPDEAVSLTERLAVTYSHPHWLIERWVAQFGLSKAKKILEFNNRVPEIFLRRKIKGITRQQFEADARTLCDAQSGGRGYKNLYYRLKKAVLPDQINLFKDGHCTVQAESSGWVVALLDVQKGEKLLDVCSAPGGKTALMSELTESKGAVCACELRLPRLRKVEETILRMQLANVYTIACDGKHLPFSGYFDKILLDAPCSGTGVMHRHPDARWFKKEQDITRNAVLQQQLLDGIAPFILKNGVIVYATCSLEPEENQQQVEHFLSNHPEFVLDRADTYIKHTYVSAQGYLFITPFEHGLDGMFAARLRKVAD